MKAPSIEARNPDTLEKKYRDSTTLKSLSLSGMVAAGLRAPLNRYPCVMISFSIVSWSW